MLTELRWNIYIQRKRIAFPIFRKLRKLHIKLLEYRKSKFRKNHLNSFSHRIFCVKLFIFSLLSHFWEKIHFFFFHFLQFKFLQTKTVERLDLDTITSFRNPILHVREIISLNEWSRKNVCLLKWLKQEFLCK